MPPPSSQQHSGASPPPLGAPPSLGTPPLPLRLDPTAPISPPPPRNPARKRRRAITDAERRELRLYNATGPGGKRNWQVLQAWFSDKYDHTLNQSSISESLSSKFQRLDSGVRHPESKKQRVCEWPDLENVLFDWQQRQQGKEAAITGEILKGMALVFWNKLPQYSDEPQPRFSTGWLDAFKARYKIKKFRRHGESGAVDRVVVEEELSELREDLKDVDSEDIYNMDETGLFWKTSPDGTLATKQTAGGKHEKAQITANFCCNATGTRKLKPWFIGKAKTSRCFGSSGVKADNLAMVWRANKTA